MGTCTRKVVFVVLYLLVIVQSKAIHTSGKLDFGDSTQVASFVKNEKRVPTKVPRTLDSISSPSEVTSKVSCGPTGCNATNYNNNSVKTEILVHVQTKVNFDQSQEKKVVDDISDVPIVVGYRGSTPDDTPDEERFRSSRPDYENRRYGSSGNGYIPNRPLYDDNPAYNQRNEPSAYYGTSTYRTVTKEYYEPSTTSFPNYYGHYGQSNTPNRFPNSYFEPSSTARPLDLNNNNYPALPVTISGYNRRNYDQNKDIGVELQIPYFEHMYNTHYFSEEPPPHTVVVGKGNSFNPVEFRTIPRNKWRPSFWNGRNNKYAFSDGGSNFVNSRHSSVPVFNQPIHHRNQEAECKCRDKEYRSDSFDGSNSYAASSVNHRIAVPSKDPGASIDDKLAPLN